MSRNWHIAAQTIFLAYASSLGASSPDTCGAMPAAGSAQQLIFAGCTVSAREWASALQQRSKLFNPGSIEAELLRAQIFMEIGRQTEAATLVQDVLAVHPENLATSLMFAGIAQTLGQFDVAENVLKKAAKLHPADPQPWKRLGDFYLSRRPDEAIAPFQRA